MREAIQGGMIVATDNLLTYTTWLGAFRARRARRTGESIVRLENGYALVSSAFRKIMKGAR